MVDSLCLAILRKRVLSSAVPRRIARRGGRRDLCPGGGGCGLEEAHAEHERGQRGGGGAGNVPVQRGHEGAHGRLLMSEDVSRTVVASVSSGRALVSTLP